MQNPNSLELTCHPLDVFDCSDWQSIEQAFAKSNCCELRQAWRDEPEPEFKPTKVRVGWRENALWVFAEMQDLDIFNPATRFNEEAYRLGDVFELFIRPAAQETYYELHVSPNNVQLQLVFPNSAGEGIRQSQSISSHFTSGMLETYTHIDSDSKRWRVLARVPAAISETREIQDNDVWLFSFCRYDYTKGNIDPVISSTSAHKIADFHRQQEWSCLKFSGE